MIAFVHIEKTAGITLNHILRRSFGTRHSDVIPIDRHSHVLTPRDLQFAKVAYRDLVSIAGHTVRPTDELRKHFPELKYYSFFRDPLSRTASHYQYQVQRMGVQEPFESWIRRDIYRNFQVRKLAGSDDLEKALEILDQAIAFVGLTHRFEESLVMLKREFGHLGIRTAYRARNVASSNTIKDRLLKDVSSRRLLKEANDLDQVLFEHATARFETQVRSYEGDLTGDVAKNKTLEPSWADTFRYGCNVLARNVYYKPILRIRRLTR